MSFCIPRKINEKLKEMLETEAISTDRLIEMTNDERVEWFNKNLGDQYGKQLNDKFERKYPTNIDEAAQQDIVDTMAKQIELKQAPDAKVPWTNTSPTPKWATEYVALQKRLKGKIEVEFTGNPIKDIGTSMKKGLEQDYWNIMDKDSFWTRAIQAGKTIFDYATSPLTKSLKASMDLSFALRQGFKVLTVDLARKSEWVAKGMVGKAPESVWANSMANAFKSIRQVKSKKALEAVMDGFKAKVLSHPNYERLMGDGKIAFNVVEDYFPTSFAEHFPIVGNMFKMSNESFTIFTQGARFKLASDMMDEQVKKLGRPLNKEEVRSIGFLANSVTGRGSLGKLEAASEELNKLLFSGRFIRSQLDTFLMPFNTTISPYAQKEATKEAIATLGTIGTLITTASMFGDVELDPRSSAFGKLRIGKSKSYVDLTAGLGSYISLAARQITKKSKSATTGKITKLNTGKYGSPTRGGVLGQFFANKLAPIPSTVNQQFLKGESYTGKKPTVSGTARNLFVPITIDNMITYKLQDEKFVTALLASMADVSGMNVTNYNTKGN